MARIFTYDQDADLNLSDKVIGSNQGDNVTKNYTIQSLLELANSENFIKQFDGIVFKAQDFNNDSDAFGVITTGTGEYTSTAFADITTLNISFKNLQDQNVAQYLDVLEGYDVRITKKGDTNNFGIFRVDAITDHIDGNYKVLTVSNQDASGQLEEGEEYYVSTLGNNLKNLNSFSVTELNDVSHAGSGQIITDAERELIGDINGKINYTDIVNNLTTDSSALPLSAAQGKILKDRQAAIDALLQTDDVDLDELQEIVDYIKQNKSTLDTLAISNIAGLQTALDGKVDTVVGKGLSEEDFTSDLKTKLDGIATNAEVNVQANWTETDTASDAFIQNKPTLAPSNAEQNVQVDWNETNTSSDSFILNKPTLAPSNAEQNVQSNWTETDTNSDAFIQNKPTILDTSTTITIAGTANQISTAPASGGSPTPQDLSANRTFTIALTNDVTINNDLTVTNDATVTGDLTADNVIVDDVLSFTTAQSSVTQDNAIYFKTESSHDILHFRYHDHDLPIDTITESISSGITSGGVLSKANTTQFTITAGSGIINDLNKESAATKPYPEIKHVTWAQQTITTSGLDSGNSEQLNTWIYIDEAGTVQQQTTPFTDAQYAHKIIVGAIVHSSGTIDFVKTFPITAYGNVTQIQEFTRIFGPLKKSGHKVTANGANLKLDRASGVAWATGRNYGTDPNNPSLISDAARTSALIHRYYSDGSTGHTKDTNAGAGYASIDPGKYDDGDGTLASMQSSKFSVQRLYYFPTTPSVIVAYYGKAFYDSIAEAEKEYLLEDFTEAENTATQAIYLGALIVKGNATDLSSSSQAKILTGGIFRSLAAVSLGGSSAASALSDLSDVDVSSPSSNQFLKYDATDGRFENATITTDDITQGTTNLYDKTVSFTNGANISVTGTYPSFTIASSHPTISAASSSDNNGRTYIQDITLDSNGHVTGLATATESVTARTDEEIQDLVGAMFTTGNTLTRISATYDDTNGNIDLTVTDQSYTLPTATSSAKGGIELFSDTVQTVAANTVSSTSSRTYGVQLNSDGQAVVNVPWTDTQISNTDVDVNKTNLKARLADFDSTDTVYIGDADDDTTVVIRGNLQVDGTTTTINSETLSTAENDLVLNNDATGTPTQDASLQVERGTSTNASILWDESAGAWKVGLLGSESQILTVGDEGSGNGIDADTLDGQEGSYYLNYSNFTNKPTIPAAANNATITIATNAGLDTSVNNTFTTNQGSDQTITFSLDLSEFNDMTQDVDGDFDELILLDNGAERRKAIGEIKLSEFNNDSGWTSNAGTVTSVGGGTGLSGTVTASGNLDLDFNSLVLESSLGDGDMLAFYDSSATTHKKISKASLIAATQTYSGGNGITITGTTIDIDADCRDDIEQIGYSTNNYYKSTSTKHSWYFGGTLAMEIDSTNKDLLVDGDVIAFSTTTSDISLKDNVETIDNALDKVHELRGVSYTWNSGSRKDQKDIGVIAQEVEQVLPDIVYSKDMIDGRNVKTVDYEKLSAVLIEAVKELSNKVNNLEKQIKDANS